MKWGHREQDSWGSVQEKHAEGRTQLPLFPPSSISEVLISPEKLSSGLFFFFFHVRFLSFLFVFG